MSQPQRHWLEEFRRYTQVRSPRKFYFYAILLGAFTGLFALGFNLGLGWLEHFFLVKLAGAPLGHPAGEFHFKESAEPRFVPWLFFLLPVAGGFLAGWIAERFAPEVAGTGINETIRSFHERESKVSGRIPIFKTLATYFTLAGGGSAGKEGPLSQIGSALGSFMGQLFGLGPKARRSLFLCGVAGALGAIFRAPLGGALAAVEILYTEDFESDSLIPAILSSMTAYFVYTSFLGFGNIHIFDLPDFVFQDWRELVFYLALGILAYLVAFVFVRVYRGSERLFQKTRLPLHWRAALGGLGVGILGLLTWEVVGSGFGFLQTLVRGDTVFSRGGILFDLISLIHIAPVWVNTVLFLGVIVLLKIVATSFTLTSGGSGGVFGPSLVIGGALGAMVGITGTNLFPGIVENYAPFVVVGMAGFFAGVANAPIASVIMVCELTGGYELLPPLMVVTTISLILARKVSIYSGQRLNKFQSPAHKWDMTNDFLKDLTIGQAFDPGRDLSILPHGTSARKIYRLSKEKQQSDFVITGDSNKIYLGVLCLRHIPFSLYGQKQKTAADFLEDPAPPPLKPDHPLTHGLEQLLHWDLDKLAVVNDENQVLGYLTFRDILKTYRREVTRYSLAEKGKKNSTAPPEAP